MMDVDFTGTVHALMSTHAPPSQSARFRKIVNQDSATDHCSGVSLPIQIWTVNKLATIKQVAMPSTITPRMMAVDCMGTVLAQTSTPARHAQ